MNFGIYLHRHSFIHKLSAGLKIFTLFALSLFLFVDLNPYFIFIILTSIICLYFMAKFSLRIIFSQIRPALWILAILFIFQLITQNIMMATLITLRFIALLLLACWVSLTTQTSKMIAAFEKGLFWLRWVGVDPAKVSFGFSLTFRFIPLIFTIMQEVREAQRSRGLEKNRLAMALPVIIRTLKMADEVTHAIEARGYDS